MPTADQIWTYFESLMNLYRKCGGRLVTEEKVVERFEICKTCSHFTGRTCDLCGCCANVERSLFNKLAFPTEQCPIGKWKNEE